MSDINFVRYGDWLSARPISLEDLRKANAATGDYWANAENSGSEGCYCEVACWNKVMRRYERFAFCKFFGGELDNYGGIQAELNCQDTAVRAAAGDHQQRA